MARCWYAYDGIGDPSLPSSYHLSSVKPSCINGGNLCALYLPCCGITACSPLSTNMRTYIANLQLTLLAQPDSNLAFKKYVYGKA